MYFVYIYVLLLHHQTKRKNKDYEKFRSSKKLEQVVKL